MDDAKTVRVRRSLASDQQLLGKVECHRNGHGFHGQGDSFKDPGLFAHVTIEGQKPDGAESVGPKCRCS